MSLTPSDIFDSPDRLKDVWIDQPISFSYYNQEEIDNQKAINEIVSEAIVTYSPVSEPYLWNEIDYEEITPYTWKWIYLDLPTQEHVVTKISLRRPNHWIKKLGADSVGKKVYLNLPEMGAQGWATVTNISANQLDTRVWNEDRQGDYVSRPITGKFVHESDNVYDLYFSGDPSVVGITGNHPVWSVDRSDWIAAEELQVGEKVKMHDRQGTLLRKEKREGKHRVYNLEVYRDHNFFVSLNAVLVHNKYLEWDSKWKSMRKTTTYEFFDYGDGYARFFFNDFIDKRDFVWLLETIHSAARIKNLVQIDARFGPKVIKELKKLKQLPKDGELMFKDRWLDYEFKRETVYDKADGVLKVTFKFGDHIKR